jgi:hypothetical protein
VENFFLTSIHILDLAQLGIVPGSGETVSLTENMFRMEFKGFLWTCFDTKGASFAEITFKRSFNVIVKKHGAERTADETLVTRDALFHIKTDDAILLVDCIGGTALATFWDTTLPAHDRHPDHRMRIKDHDPDPAFFRIVGPFATDTASQFAHFATGTTLRYDCQMH